MDKFLIWMLKIRALAVLSAVSGESLPGTTTVQVSVSPAVLFNKHFSAIADFSALTLIAFEREATCTRRWHLINVGWLNCYLNKT